MSPYPFRGGMRNRSALHLASSASCAALLGAAALAPVTAHAADAHYQEQRSLTCASGFCTAKFPKAGNNRVLVLETVICEGGVQNGAVEQAYVSFNTGGKQFILALGLDWERLQGTFRTYVFSRQAKIEIPGSESPSGVLAVDGATANGRCTLVGTVKD